VTDRKGLADELEKIAVYFKDRMRDCKSDAKNIHFYRSEILRVAAAVIRSDEETLREYEEYVDGLEDDGK